MNEEALMGLDENKAIIRRFVDEVVNKGNMASVDEFLASGFTIHFPTLPAMEGADAFVEIPTAVRSAFPDLVETIEDLVAEGDRVVERATIRGTHLGEFMGQLPTDKPVSWTGIFNIDWKTERLRSVGPSQTFSDSCCRRERLL